MKGTILSVDVKNGSGVIHGENYLPYRFDMTGWNESNCYPVKGMAVIFEVGDSFSAYKITINTSIKKIKNPINLWSISLKLGAFFVISMFLLANFFLPFWDDYQAKQAEIDSASEETTLDPDPPKPDPKPTVKFELESEKPNSTFTPTPSNGLFPTPDSTSISSELEASSSVISEATKLANRRKRWKSAEKCLQALLAINGNVETLCSQNLDIYQLSQEKDGIFLVSIIIKEHLDAINQYEKQLNEGIISTLPKDEAMTSIAYFNNMQAYHKLTFSMLESQKTRGITCVYSMELGEKTQQECDAERTQYEQEAKEKEQEYETVEKQIDDYKKNYKPDP